MILEEERCLQSRRTPVDVVEARHFLAGLVNRLRLRGGIHHDLLASYVRNSGNRFFLSKSCQCQEAMFPGKWLHRHSQGR